MSRSDGWCRAETFDERADGLTKADDVRCLWITQNELSTDPLEGRSGGRGERSWVSGPLGSELCDVTPEPTPRAAFWFVRRNLYELGRCNSQNTARRSRARGRGEATALLWRSRMRVARGYWGFEGGVPGTPPVFRFVGFSSVGSMRYRCEVVSVEGFIQQLAVAYVSRGYFFYVTGRIPDTQRSGTGSMRNSSNGIGIDLTRSGRVLGGSSCRRGEHSVPSAR